MKAARRQELRTNVLSQQIDKLSETFKRHSATLAGIIIAAMVIVLGSYWYANHKASVVSESVAKLSFDPDKDDAMGFIDRARSVANEQVSADVSRMAWLRVGAFALNELESPPSDTEAAKKPKANPAELNKAAREAFNRVLAMSDRAPTARAAAHFGLGVLDENEGKFDSAKEHYSAVKADKDLQGGPFITQADYRLAHLTDWAKEITFAPPPILPPAPEGSLANPMSSAPQPGGTFTPPAGASATPPPVNPAMPANSTPPPAANATTTQPAG